MSESVYRVTELVGVSTESWEAAARNAVETAVEDLAGPAYRRGSPLRRHDRGRQGDDLPRASERVVQVRIWRLSSAWRELGSPVLRISAL